MIKYGKLFKKIIIGRMLQEVLLMTVVLENRILNRIAVEAFPLKNKENNFSLFSFGEEKFIEENLTKEEVLHFYSMEYVKDSDLLEKIEIHLDEGLVGFSKISFDLKAKYLNNRGIFDEK
jgi:hypothetical protein